MKLFLLSAFGVMVAMSVAAPPAMTPVEDQLQKLQEIAEERAKFFRELLGEAKVDDAGEAPAVPVVRKTDPAPLRLGGLGKSSLQPARGVQSSARGLTPEEEWRRMFPHRPGYSR